MTYGSEEERVTGGEALELSSVAKLFGFQKAIKTKVDIANSLYATASSIQHIVVRSINFIRRFLVLE